MFREMKDVRPDIFAFQDYRAFLNVFFRNKKAAWPSFSLRVWCRQLGLRSPATLNMILQGHRHPGDGLLEKLLLYFGFNETEKQYFEDLIRLGKHRGGERRRQDLLQRLQQLGPGKRPVEMDFAAFTAISNWYCYAIREMVSLKDFRRDPEWIAAKLHPRVPVRKAKAALRLLLRLGTLTENADGALAKAEDFVVTRSDVADEGVRHFHRQVLDLAKRALTEVPLEEREFHALTFNIDRRDLPALKAEIRQALNRVAIKYDRAAGDATYQMNTQLFPLTERSSS